MFASYALIAVIVALACFVVGVVFGPTVIKHLADARKELEAKYKADLDATHAEVEAIRNDCFKVVKAAEARAVRAETELKTFTEKLEFFKTSLTPAQVAALPTTTAQ